MKANSRTRRPERAFARICTKAAMFALPALAIVAIVTSLSTSEAGATGLRHSGGFGMPRSAGLGHSDHGMRAMRIEPRVDGSVLGGIAKPRINSIAPETANGPDPIPHKPRWKNNQGGLLGGMGPPPRRHPCSPPGYYPVPGCR